MYFLEVLMRQLFAKTLDTSPLEDDNMSVICGMIQLWVFGKSFSFWQKACSNGGKSTLQKSRVWFDEPLNFHISHEEDHNMVLLCFFYPGGRRRSEPDEAELLRVSRRLVEDAVNRALQQYKQETLQNGGGPNATAVQPPGNTEESATKTDTTANSTKDNRKWHHRTEAQRLKKQPPRQHQPGLANQEKSQ